MDATQLLEYSTTAVFWGSAIVGAASAILRALSGLTSITPNTWDDQALNRAGRVVGYVARVLDLIALNFPQSKARRG